MTAKHLDEFQAWLKKQAEEARKRGSVYFDGLACAFNDAFEYLAILRMQTKCDVASFHGSALPTEAGFYWWRPAMAVAWRMIKVSSVPGVPAHSADDVSRQSFTGRPIKGWADDFPVGEWVAVPMPPNSTASATGKEERS